jgi:uncharacterized protein
MRCPADETELKMAERQGIEIDYCPQCRGVWLDRGELDRIIERSASESSPRPDERGGYSEERRIHDSDDGKYYEKGRDPRYGRKGKRKSFLGELFDFD